MQSVLNVPSQQSCEELIKAVWNYIKRGYTTWNNQQTETYQ